MLEGNDLVDTYVSHQSVRTAIEDSDLFAYRHGGVLGLYQQLVVLSSAVDGHDGHGIHVAAELGESVQFTELCLGDFQRAGHFLHALDLRAAAHTGYGDTYIDGRTEALVEQVSFEEYLSVGDGNHIRRDVGGHVACLCLDDRECRERTSAFHFSFQAFRQVVHLLGHILLVDDFGSTFQQAGVQVEDVAGVSFATRRTAQDERNLAVGYGLFGKVVEYD